MNTILCIQFYWWIASTRAIRVRYDARPSEKGVSYSRWEEEKPLSDDGGVPPGNVTGSIFFVFAHLFFSARDTSSQKEADLPRGHLSPVANSSSFNSSSSSCPSSSDRYRRYGISTGAL